MSVSWIPCYQVLIEEVSDQYRYKIVYGESLVYRGKLLYTTKQEAKSEGYLKLRQQMEIVNRGL